MKNRNFKTFYKDLIKKSFYGLFCKFIKTLLNAVIFANVTVIYVPDVRSQLTDLITYIDNYYVSLISTEFKNKVGLRQFFSINGIHFFRF